MLLMIWKRFLVIAEITLIDYLAVFLHDVGTLLQFLVNQFYANFSEQYRVGVYMLYTII